MDDDLRCAKGLGDSALDLVGDRVCIVDGRGPGDSDRDFREHDARCAGARAYRPYLSDSWNALDEPPHVGGVEASLIHENRDRLLEDLVTVPRNDQSDDEREHRI